VGGSRGQHGFERLEVGMDVGDEQRAHGLIPGNPRHAQGWRRVESRLLPYSTEATPVS
jgi:hypothetical protein